MAIEHALIFTLSGLLLTGRIYSGKLLHSCFLYRLEIIINTHASDVFIAVESVCEQKTKHIKIIATAAAEINFV